MSRLAPPIITAFKNSPDGGRGMARDMPVRWALEEVGHAYDVRLVPLQETWAPAHVALQPFGQIPTYEEDGLVLFESSAIVLHIAERHAGLLPADADARARAIAWMFCARTTVEQPVLDREAAVREGKGQAWYAERGPVLDERVRERLDQLSRRLGEAEWLDGAFSAGDLTMVIVLRRLKMSGMLDDYPNLAAYVARAEARPAFQRAFAAQLAVFEASQAG